MNRQLFKVIFNKKRGAMTVVSECAKAQGKVSHSSVTLMRVSHFWRFTVLSNVILSAFGISSPVLAQGIVADGLASKHQQATILRTASGVPQVNIQTPSSEGVSINQFSQFDVTAKGAILNNSRQAVQTQTAGWVAANPWLARGEARIIVNQVNSARASILGGTIEVAGRRAEVVVANPAGIEVNGGRFINAAGVTLTTGRPQYASGTLQGYQVREGMLTIAGAGLDTSSADYTRLLSRAAQIQGGIWAQDLQLIAGRNDIAHDSKSGVSAVVVEHEHGAPPKVAIDTGNLGGMYAGSIQLISTEKGVGVNHAGQALASAGQVQISVDGQLSHQGQISANQAEVQLNVRSLVNEGTISTKRDLRVQSEQLHNQGVLTTPETLFVRNKALFHNKGDIVARRMDIETESLRQGEGANFIQSGEQGLHLTTAKLDNRGQMGVIAEPQMKPDLNQRLPDSSKTEATQTQVESEVMTPVLDNMQVTVIPAGKLRITQALENAGRILSNQAVTLEVSQSLNNSGQLYTNDLDVKGSLFKNRGEIQSQHGLNIQVHQLDNQQGILKGQEHVKISATHLNNQQGVIQAQKTLDIGVKQAIENQQGQLLANDGIMLTSTDLTNSQQGSIQAGYIQTVQHNRLMNEGGEITAQHDITVKVGQLSNRYGIVQAQQDIHLHVGGTLENQSGKIYADTVKADVKGDIYHAQGTIDAQTGIELTIGGGLVQEGAKLLAGEAIKINAQQVLGEGNVWQAGQSLQINTTGQLQQRQGSMYAGHRLTLAANEVDLARSQGYANRGIQVDAQGNIDLSQSQWLSQGDVLFKGAQLNLAQASLSTQGAVKISAEQLLHQNAQTQAQQDMTINVQGALENLSGKFLSGKNLQVQAQRVDNTLGMLGSTQRLHVSVAEQLANIQGELLAGEHMQVVAPVLDNEKGRIASGGNVELTLAERLHNQAGQMVADGEITIADKVVNVSERRLQINHQGGDIHANQGVTIHAKSLSGDGRLSSSQGLSIQVRDDFISASDITVGSQLHISSLGKVHNAHRWQTGETLRISAKGIENTASGELIGDKEVMLHSEGLLSNRGLINSHGLTAIRAKEVQNIGTGRVYGDHVAIEADKLLNAEETQANGDKKSAVIAAREHLALGVGHLINQEDSLLLSADTLVIGGRLTEDYQAIGKAQRVDNQGGKIEAGGDMSLAVAHLQNDNSNFALAKKVAIGQPSTHNEVAKSGESFRRQMSDLKWVKFSRAGKLVNKNMADYGGGIELGVTPIPSVYETLCYRQGGAAYECEDGVEKFNYDIDDPVWAYFGVTAPQAEPTQQPQSEEEPQPPVEPYHSGYCAAGSPNAIQAVCVTYQEQMAAYAQEKSIYDTYQAWITQNIPLYDALEEKIDAYNARFRVEIKDFTHYLFKRYQFEDQVASSKPGQIIAGGNLQLTGDKFVNDKSHIIAGKTLSGDVGNLQNIEAEGLHYIEDRGTSQYTRTRWRGGFKRYHERKWSRKRSYERDYQESIVIPVTRVESQRGLVTNPYAISDVTQKQVNQREADDGRMAKEMDNTSRPPGLQTQTQGANISAVRISDLPQVILPTQSIYRIAPHHPQYVVQTDPAFADYRRWLGSDYMLKALQGDGNWQHKRLGDAYYEQRLVRDQIMQATGQRYLQGYHDDQAQFKALMQSGITAAKAMNLRPGIALSAEQVARLSSDIVWLEWQQVRLTDGRFEKVLVPRVYLLPRSGDVNTKGALIAADRIELNVQGDMHNAGVIAGRQIVNLKAENIAHTGQIQGETVNVSANERLRIQGGQVHAQDDIYLHAGKMVDVQSTTRSTTNQANGFTANWTGLDRVAGLYVKQADGQLVIASSGDIQLLGAQLSSLGEMTLLAGRDISVAGVKTETFERTQNNARNYRQEGETQEVGSRLSAQGNLRLQADNAVTVRGSQLESQKGTLLVSAQQDLTIEAGEQTQDYAEHRYHKDRSGLGSKSRERYYREQAQEAIASELTGQHVQLLSGEDLTVSGSQVVSDRGTKLWAGDTLSIEAANQQYEHIYYAKDTKSGVWGTGGMGFTIGRQAQSLRQGTQTQTVLGSMVGSLEGLSLASQKSNPQRFLPLQNP